MAPVARVVPFYAVEDLIPNSTDYNLIVKVGEVLSTATVLRRTRTGRAVPEEHPVAIVGDESGSIRFVTRKLRAAFDTHVKEDAVVLLLHVNVRRVGNQVYIEAEHLASKIVPIAKYKLPAGIPMPNTVNVLLDRSDASAKLDADAVKAMTEQRDKLHTKLLFRQIERLIFPNKETPKADSEVVQKATQMFLQKPFVDRSYLLHAQNAAKLQAFLDTAEVFDSESESDSDETESSITKDPSLDKFSRDPSGTGMSTLLSKDWRRDERAKGRQIKGSRNSRRGIPDKAKKTKGNSRRHIENPTGILRRMRNEEVQAECNDPSDFAIA
eukprot:TRINITY_DN4381_c0_g1_i1.p1 TRINITY_DN4381_c0_g1~~TRINITY_DN4381_c0_g1_i1.p1  ORF type:complete len:333 (+),score=54.77 TRINITY_DN4381_c0_g1_i1:22-999(+)